MEKGTGTRRSFLNRLIGGWLAVAFSPANVALVEYLIPPRLRERVVQSIAAGTLADLAAAGFKMVRFNKKPVILVSTGEGQVRAFSAVCTHLGCIVEFTPADKKFHCNCHGSVFGIDGSNVAGPAPRPLKPLRVSIKDTEIVVSDI